MPHDEPCRPTRDVAARRGPEGDPEDSPRTANRAKPDGERDARPVEDGRQEVPAEVVRPSGVCGVDALPSIPGGVKLSRGRGRRGPSGSCGANPWREGRRRKEESQRQERRSTVSPGAGKEGVEEVLSPCGEKAGAGGARTRRAWRLPCVRGAGARRGPPRRGAPPSRAGSSVMPLSRDRMRGSTTNVRMSTKEVESRNEQEREFSNQRYAAMKGCRRSATACRNNEPHAGATGTRSR